MEDGVVEGHVCFEAFAHEFAAFEREDGVAQHGDIFGSGTLGGAGGQLRLDR